MNRRSCALLLVLLGLVRLSPPYAMAENAAAEAAVAALEQQWVQYERANTAGLAADLMDDACVFTSSTGKVYGKTEFIERDVATRYEHVDYADLKVRVHGTTAIVTAIFQARGTNPTGERLDVSERVTNTWAQNPGGEWRLVANHQSTIAK
jgi:uncharacterized protein (TIGR02246 family)